MNHNVQEKFDTHPSISIKFSILSWKRRSRRVCFSSDLKISNIEIDSDSRIWESEVFDIEKTLFSYRECLRGCELTSSPTKSTSLTSTTWSQKSSIFIYIISYNETQSRTKIDYTQYFYSPSQQRLHVESVMVQPRSMTCHWRKMDRFNVSRTVEMQQEFQKDSRRETADTRVPPRDTTKSYVKAGAVDSDGKVDQKHDEGYLHKWWRGLHCLIIRARRGWVPTYDLSVHRLRRFSAKSSLSRQGTKQ